MLICTSADHTGTVCETQNKNDAKFCAKCGRSLRTALELHDPGDVVGDYTIRSMIGYGGFGAVYAAEDRRKPGELLALKETLDPVSVHSLQHEFSIIQGLAHPNIPRYHASFEVQGNGYLVMELVPGQNLDEVLVQQAGPLLENQVLGYALQLCDVVQYLHTRPTPILHRDIKPANIRLTAAALIKLVDFGLLKQAGMETRKTVRGAGTAAYAPLEQYGGKEHTDARSDLYSLAATLYHLLSGQEPLPAGVRIAAATDPLPPLRNVSPHVAAAITQALSLRSQDRQPNVARFKDALLGIGVQAPPPPPAVVKKPSARAKPVAPVTPVPAAPQPPALPAWAPALIHIPAGPFLFGEAKQTMHLPDYWMGETPVTNAQFRRFVEGDGYRNQAYWTPNGWAWRQGANRQQPSYWTDVTWNGADYPVVGVAWYEAAAYCQWLSAQTNQTFRLPTEAEWEKAARGTDGRVYPWGDTWELGRCNSEEAKVRKTTPVGKYPTGASPYGLLDMAGNVWEWCSSSYKSYPAGSALVQKDFTTDDYDAPLRGGSWWTNRTGVGCTMWFRFHAIDLNYYDRGFRVVLIERPVW